MELNLGKQKFLTIKDNNSSNCRTKLWHQFNGKCIQLSNIQTKMMLDGLDIIDNGANIAWEHLNAESKREYQYHLGYGVNLTLSLYQGARYYDIRKWWLPENSNTPRPTRVGITLNASQMTLLCQSRNAIMQTIPELEEIEPCQCFLDIVSYAKCLRCNPWAKIIQPTNQTSDTPDNVLSESEIKDLMYEWNIL